MKKGTITQDDQKKTLARIKTETQLAASVRNADFVVEAATERFDLKTEIFRTLDANADVVLVVEFLRENAQRFGRSVEELETHLKSLGFRLFSITVGGLDAYAPVTELGVNVVAAPSFDTVLPALRGPAAAHLLMRLAGIAPASS